MKAKKEQREFAGAKPRNNSIVDKVRKEGYFGVLFNRDDFLDAVVWAANQIYDYRDFFVRYEDWFVIPMKELPFYKPDLKNAHFLMILYYNRKGNPVLEEEVKLSLYTIAKFQNIEPEDIPIIEKWNQNMMQGQKKLDDSDFTEQDMSSLRGTEVIFKKYTSMASEELKELHAEIAKLP